MGDLHQPLHVGNGLDRGASTCKVTYFGVKYTLHQVIDEVMIDFTKLSYSEFAKLILEGKSENDFKAIRVGNALDWARESRDLRDALYPAEVEGSNNELKNYCVENVDEKKMPELGHSYNYQHMKTVNKRLLEGGVRLAWLLNGIFSQK